MKPLTQDQKDKISNILEEILSRPELLKYMREQLWNSFWQKIREAEDEP